MNELVGKAFIFEDGAKIEVIQVKSREDDDLVTYHVTYGNSLPRKLVMSMTEFMSTFGHLFKEKQKND